ncbi:MAG: serine protease, partial [Pseudomonadota bacterium]
VNAKRLHKGFGTFRVEVEDHQPIRKNSSLYSPQAAPLRDLAFDVALLTVDPMDPETGENDLGPDLTIADEEKLLALQAGSAIAVIGFPYDTLDDGFAPDAGTARVERGVIAAVTPPLDTIAEARNPATANLIIHRLATAGGSSGSPIIDASGEVIAVHTHGVESPSSNADGAAQRAESLLDLFSDEREATRLNEVFRPAWRSLLSHWARADDALPWSFFMEYARPGETPAPLVASIEDFAVAPFSHSIDTIDFGEDVAERRVDASDILNASVEGGASVTAQKKSFLINEPGQYAEVWRTVDRSSEHVLFAFDYSLRSRTGFCPLTSYWRKKGETRLRKQRGRATFELHLPPAGDAIEDYQIILRRSAKCDPISSQFMIGSVSWDAENESPIQSASLSSGRDATNQTTPHATTAGYLAPLRARLKRFVECRIKNEKNVDLCEQQEYVELDDSGSE